MRRRLAEQREKIYAAGTRHRFNGEPGIIASKRDIPGLGVILDFKTDSGKECAVRYNELEPEHCGKFESAPVP